jgi:hypothetical protein
MGEFSDLGLVAVQLIDFIGGDAGISSHAFFLDYLVGFFIAVFVGRLNDFDIGIHGKPPRFR